LALRKLLEFGAPGAQLLVMTAHIFEPVNFLVEPG